MKKSIKELNFNELLEELTKLSKTWYPELIIQMVKTAYKKEIFVPGGASQLIQYHELQIGKSGKY